MKTVLGCYVFEHPRIGSYFQNLFWRKLVEAIQLSNRPALSSLIDTVFNIFSVGSKKQMIGIYAGWIVTAVQNAESVWDRANTAFIRNTMRQFLFVPYGKNAISTFISIAFPFCTTSLRNNRASIRQGMMDISHLSAFLIQMVRTLVNVEAFARVCMIQHNARICR